MSIPTSEQYPDDPEGMPAARKRRAQRLLAPLDADERARYLDKLDRLTAPSFDFYLLSLAAGLLISLGLLLDTPAFLILGAALAPLMAPVVGISLGTIIGSVRLFFSNAAGLLIGCAVVFLSGWAAGRYGSPWLSETQYLSHLHAQISWPNFVVLAISAMLTTIGIVRSNERTGAFASVISSAALAYELFLPLAAAGLGLGSGILYLFPDGLIVFILHIAWSSLLGAMMLALLGLRPLTLFGYTLGGVLTLVGVILLAGLLGAGAVVGTGMGLPTPTSTITPTLTNTPTFTSTPVPPTATLTPSLTPSLTLTPTTTFTLTPTPILAEVRADVAEGARIRAEPNGETVGFLANGALLILLPENKEVDGVFWVRVQTPEGLQGWVVQSLLRRTTATPSP